MELGDAIGRVGGRGGSPGGSQHVSANESLPRRSSEPVSGRFGPVCGQIPPVSIATPLRGRVLTVRGSIDERIAAIASHQSGRLSRSQLIAAGASSSSITRRVNAGRLIRVARGVYAVGHVAPAPYLKEVDALLGLAGQALLSHLTAARLWRIHMPADDRYVDLLVSHDARHCMTTARVHRANDFERLRPVYLHDLPVVPVPLALFQIAALVSSRELERAVDEALARELTSTEALHRALNEYSTRVGRVALRRVLADRVEAAGFTRSAMERRMLELIREAGPPEPVKNAQIGEFTADFYWPQCKVAVEMDSYRWHRVRSNWERDRRKDIVFKAAGIDLTRLTWSALTHERLRTAALMGGLLVNCPRQTG